MAKLNYSFVEFIPVLRIFPQRFRLYKKPRCVRVFLFLLLNAYRETNFTSGGSEEYVERKGQYKCTISEIVDSLGGGITRNDINYTIKLLKKAGYILYKGFKKKAATLFEIVDYEQYSLENIAYRMGGWFPIYKDCLLLPVFKEDESFRVYISLMSRIVNPVNIIPISLDGLHRETGVPLAKVLSSLNELRKLNIIVYKKIDKDRILTFPCNHGMIKYRKKN